MTRRIGIALAAGLVTGFLILGAGGRIAMRVAAYAITASPDMTVNGTLLVLGIGSVWGCVTAPFLVLLERVGPRTRRHAGVILGLVSLLLAVLIFAFVGGFIGGIVAPPMFIALGVLLFTTLFLVNGLVVQALVTRWSPHADLTD
jgi:hypothetical protein